MQVCAEAEIQRESGCPLTKLSRSCTCQTCQVYGQSLSQSVSSRSRLVEEKDSVSGSGPANVSLAVPEFGAKNIAVKTAAASASASLYKMSSVTVLLSCCCKVTAVPDAPAVLGAVRPPLKPLPEGKETQLDSSGICCCMVGTAHVPDAGACMENGAENEGAAVLAGPVPSGAALASCATLSCFAVRLLCLLTTSLLLAPLTALALAGMKDKLPGLRATAELPGCESCWTSVEAGAAKMPGVVLCGCVAWLLLGAVPWNAESQLGLAEASAGTAELGAAEDPGAVLCCCVRLGPLHTEAPRAAGKPGAAKALITVLCCSAGWLLAPLPLLLRMKLRLGLTGESAASDPVLSLKPEVSAHPEIAV